MLDSSSQEIIQNILVKRLLDLDFCLFYYKVIKLQCLSGIKFELNPQTHPLVTILI